MRGGVFGVLEGRFAGDFRAVARWGRGVLPRNSGVLGWARARRGDSAHGGQCQVVGAKKFLKKGADKGEKPKNWGYEGCRKVVWEHLI